MPSKWTPLSQRDNSDSEYHGLHEGVPPWLLQTLLTWIEHAFAHTRSTQAGRRVEMSYPVQTMRAAERELRFHLRETEGFWMWSELRALLEVDEILMLDVIDWALHKGSYGSGTTKVTELNGYLESGGSVWVAVPVSEVHELQRRVEAAALIAVTAATTPADNASTHLRDAWSKAYGRNPDPSGAYREAVRAVEAVAKPTIAPKDNLATLGKMIRAIEDAPHKFAIALDPKGIPPIDGLVTMMKLLWTAQLDRHGTDDTTKPLNVTQDQAESAVNLAVTLVQWFRSGAVSRI